MPLAVTGLVRIDMPDTTVVRLAEGSDVRWASETYLARDPAWGSIGSVDALEEGIGNVVPAAQLVLNTPATVSAAALVQPGAQKSRVRMWLATYDYDTSVVIDAGATVFDGFLDQARLVRAREFLRLELAVVSRLEHLFELNLGNSLNPTFHRSIWPGEGGEDQATGLTLSDAWGTEAPNPTVTGGGNITTYWGTKPK